HQAVAGRIDVVHLEGEVAEIARLAVVLGVPIVSELEQRCVAAGGETRLDQGPVLRGSKKHIGVTSLFVRAAPQLNDPELVAKESQRGVEIANPQHGMKISHDGPFVWVVHALEALPGQGSSSTVQARRKSKPDLLLGYQYMIAADIETGIARLRDLVDEADAVVPFTGAGICTECGIADFRSPGGLWTKYQPIAFDEFMASAEMRSESWRRRFAMEKQFSTARPGCGHLALASLHRSGKIPAVITQNIDNLHQASGFAADKVVELHGNTTYATCLDCSRRYELAWVKSCFDEKVR